jgi:hypothetical protein
MAGVFLVGCVFLVGWRFLVGLSSVVFAGFATFFVEAATEMRFDRRIGMLGDLEAMFWRHLISKRTTEDRGNLDKF